MDNQMNLLQINGIKIFTFQFISLFQYNPISKAQFSIFSLVFISLSLLLGNYVQCKTMTIGPFFKLWPKYLEITISIVFLTISLDNSKQKISTL